jgi:ActR/RegA family two-component response regulator
MSGRPRVIVASPDAVECEVLAGWLAADGFEPIRRSSLERAVDSVRTLAFDLLVADFAFAFEHGLHAFSRQRVRNIKTPAVVIGEIDVAGRTRAVDRRAMYLSRPVDRSALLCTVSMAILDGRPVRCSPRKTVYAVDALVNDAPSHLVDLSHEGLRLEIPRERRSSPPPYFNLRVPMFDVTITVKRMWARAAVGSLRDEFVSCGGAVAPDAGSRAQAWRAFVEAVPAREESASDRLRVRLEQRD